MRPALVGVLALAAQCAAVACPGQDTLGPVAQIPDPGVPQAMTMEGAYVRAAYNSEGYVVVGYRAANGSVGEPWMLLDVGMALRQVKKRETLARDEVWLTTPAGKIVQLPSNGEYLAARLSALEYRARVASDSLAFPAETATGVNCGDDGRFFYDAPDDIRYAKDVPPPLHGVTLGPTCRWAGRLYFPVEGGITYGQYWLNVKFDGSLVRVPLRIMTEDEERILRRHYSRIKKQLDDRNGAKKQQRETSVLR
jgi:hypothetical protein